VTDDRRDTQRRRAWEQREVDAAANAAGAIGGRAPEDADPAERPLQGAGEGEAEGFELAEADLIRAAETGDAGADPLRAAFPAESEDAGATYGEADQELSSELPDDDR